MDRNAKARKVVSHIFAVAAVGVGIGLIFASRAGNRLEAMLAQRGQRVTGVVDHGSVREPRGTVRQQRRRETGYYLAVRYPVGAGSEYASFKVSYDSYRQHGAGSRVPVIYDPQDPKVARLESGLHVQASSSQLLIAGIVSIPLGIGLFAFLVVYHRRKGLEESYPDTNHLDTMNRGG